MTVLARMRAAGIAESAALRHLNEGRVRVAGVPTTDPTTPAPHPAAVTLWSGEPRPIGTPPRWP